MGAFCADNGCLFATGGIRKEFGEFKSKVYIIPRIPIIPNQEIMTDSIDKATTFKTGESETIKNPDDEYMKV